MSLHWVRLGLIACLLAVTVGCGGDSADDSGTQPNEPESSGDDAENEADAPEPGEAGEVSQVTDCGAFQQAATSIVDAASLSVSDSPPTFCQYFDQSGADGLSGRLYVRTPGYSISGTPELDSALGFSYDDTRTYTESDVEGWSLAAETSYSEPDPTFPDSTTERILVLGGNGIEGVLTCTLALKQTGQAGDQPPPPPTVDVAVMDTFCNAAKDALFTE